MKKISSKKEALKKARCFLNMTSAAVSGVSIYKAYRKGHEVKIHKTDGTTVVQCFKLEEGAVMLESDVRKYFPDSDAVNKALRSLIQIIPGELRTVAKAK